MNEFVQSVKSFRKYSVILIIAVSLLLVGTVFFWLQAGEAAADPAVTEHSFEGGFASWSIHPYTARVLQNNTFTIALSDSYGKPLTGANLHIKLEMPRMLCGDYSFTLVETEPGTYIGEGVPLMAGLWQATLTIRGSGVSNKAVTAITRTLIASH